jgi:hypothetical protein
MGIEDNSSKKLCFVVAPIGAADSDIRIHSDFLLDFIIKPVMTKFPAYAVRRADQMSRPGMIDTQIITALRDADLVIADLSCLNPNAFYEIGIRHMFAKPIVHMQLETEEIPFDVSLYSAIKFSMRRPQDFETAKTALEQHIKEAIDPKHVVDNPVTRVLGREKSDASAMPEVKALSATVNSLTEEIADLRQTIDSDRNYSNLMHGLPPVQPPSAQALSYIQALVRGAPRATLISESNESPITTAFREAADRMRDPPAKKE